MNARVLLMFCLCLCLAPASAFAALSNGTAASTAQFLRLGPGARALGMGEAYGPVADGPDALYWNPAGLAQLARPAASYSHAEMLSYFHHDYAAYAHPFRNGTFGASVTVFSQTAQDIVTNANRVAGQFSSNSEAYALGYAHDSHLGERTHLLWGLALKGVRETIYNRSSGAVAADGGVILKSGALSEDLRPLSFSFAFHNLGTQERFIHDQERLPAEIDAGVAYLLGRTGSHLLPAFEFAVPYDGAPFAKLGLEYGRSFGENTAAALRLGYKTNALDLGFLAGLTAGVGVQYRRLAFDLAFQPMAQLGEVYRLSVGYRF